MRKSFAATESDKNFALIVASDGDDNGPLCEVIMTHCPHHRARCTTMSVVKKQSQEGINVTAAVIVVRAYFAIIAHRFLENYGSKKNLL